MSKRITTIASAAAVAAALALWGCGGTEMSLPASDFQPLISDQVASALQLESEDVQASGSGEARYNLEAVVYRLRDVLAPLYSQYGLTFAGEWNTSTAYRALLSQVRFSIAAAPSPWSTRRRAA